MGAQAWPFNYATTGDPAYTAQQLRQLSVAPFVAMGSSGRPLGAKSGIRVGTPSSVATITGSGPYSWNIGGFAGVIDGEANAAAGPYTYSFDTTQTGTIAAAGAAARVDAVDVVISDSDEGDGSGAKNVTCMYTQGPATGGGTPAAPARSHRLFLINVPTSGAPTIQWAPDWSGDPGEWTFNTLAELTAYTTLITAANVPVNQRATVITDITAANNGDYIWTGSSWALSAGTTPQIWMDRANVGVSGAGSAWNALATTGWMTQTKNVGFAAWNGTIVAPLTGRYRLDVGAYITGVASCILSVTKNNATPGQTNPVINISGAAAGGETIPQGSKIVTLTAGDVLRINVFPSANWGWDTDPSSGWFGLQYLGV